MKAVKFFLALFFVFALTLNAQQVQTGTFVFDSTVKGYSFDKDSGERTVQIEVAFKKSFDAKPEILLSVTSIDADKEKNLRYEIKSMVVSRDGFVISARTWSDSKIYSIGGTWMAITSK